MRKIKFNDKGYFLFVSSMGHSVETAIADLVDNSIQAEASKFQFGFFYDDVNPKKSFAYFYDDGTGMNEKELENAMDLGSLQRKDKQLHSKFGLGLKIASLSNCKQFQVFSKQKKSKACSSKAIVDEDEETIYITEKTNIPEKFKNVFHNFSQDKNGTLIIWENLKKNNRFNTDSHSNFFSKVTNIQSHLMLTFYRQIKNKSLSIFYGDKKLGFIDPEMPHPNTLRKPTTKLKINKHIIEITPICIPTENKYNFSREDERITNNFLINNKMDGLYFFRNDRLIDFGGWWQIITDSMKSNSLTRRIRIIISFKGDKELDKKFGIEPTKSEIELPDEIKQTVYNLFDDLMKKIKAKTPNKKRKAVLNTKLPDLWKINNGRVKLNFDNKDVKKAIQNNKDIRKLLENIQTSIPEIITYSIDLDDLSGDKKSMMHRAIEIIENRNPENKADLKNHIQLLCTKSPFKFENDIINKLMRHFNVN